MMGIGQIRDLRSYENNLPNSRFEKKDFTMKTMGEGNRRLDL